MPKCEICGKQLANPLSSSHINSKFHKEALKKQDFEPEQENFETIIKEILEKPAPPKIPKPPKSTGAPKKLEKIKLQPLHLSVQIPKKPKSEPKVDGSDALEYNSEEDLDLFIPAIPEPPKMKKRLTLDSSNLSVNVLDKMAEMETDNVKVVLVNCEKCGDVIPIPIPREMVKKSELPVVPISYIHKNKRDKEQHCITIHIDKDFDIRRQRYSEVILEKETP
jgi:hypothetical protein